MPFMRYFCTTKINKIAKYLPNFTTISFINHDTFHLSQGVEQVEITALSSRNHLEKLQKSRHFSSVFLRKSCGNHGNFLKKPRRKVTEIIKKNMVKVLNVGKCRFM
jgi:hypothetical protein